MANSQSAAAVPPARVGPGWVIAVLLLAAAWRSAIALNLPTLSRDGVTFCWYARGLGEQGLDYLRGPSAIQHPLYPALILGAERLAEAAGHRPSPLVWQRSAQVVAGLAGLAVVLLVGGIARRLVSCGLAGPRSVVLAMLLAALLPLNVELSADGMSDQVHLMFYLAAILAGMQAPRLASGFLAGILSGLAFLTRPEGLVAGVAAALVAVASPGSAGGRAARFVAVLAGVALVASPYWIITGELSAKKNPLEWIETASTSVQRAEAGRGEWSWSKLERVELRWFELAPRVLLEVLRGGRVIVVLLAIAPIARLGRAWLQPPLLVLTACALGHFSLLLILLEREGYLAPRHTLVIVSALIPAAAAVLAWLSDAAGPRGWLRRALVGACFVPLVIYSLRLPNDAERWMRTAAEWLVAHDPDVSNKRILGGASTKRLAFYAGAAWSEWNEQPRYYTALCDMMKRIRPDYFAIETGSGFERTGNRELLERLLAEGRFAGRIRRLHTERDGRGNELHVLALDWE